MIELFVEGKKVDISEEFSTLLTLTIDDIKDFGAKNTTFSKTIILPGTKNNGKIFGNIFDIGGSNYFNPLLPNVALNYNPAIGARAYIFSHNMQVFKGVLRMMEVINDDGFTEYEVAVFGELSNLVGKIGSKLLEDLDFSAYDVIYNETNIAASWANTPGSGIYFPHIDYGNYSVAKHNWEYRTFRPALYAKEYIDKIFAAANCIYSSALFNTARFKSLIVPHNRKELSMRGDRVAFANVIPTSYTINELPAGNPISIALNGFSGTNWVLVSGSNVTYTAAPTVNVKIDIRVEGIYNYDTLSPLQSEGIFCELHYWTAVSSSGTPIASQFIPGGALDIPFAVDFNLPAQLMNQNDFLQVVFYSAVTPTSEITLTGGTLTVRTQQVGWVDVNYNDLMLVNDSIPKNILQKDFLSSILKLFNCYVFDDYDTEGLLNIMPFVDYYLDAGVDDWTSKVDRSKPIKHKPLGELTARYYEFKYKGDGDYYNDLYEKRYNKTYGSFIYDSEFEFVNESKSIELIFAGTPLVGYAGQDKVYSTIMKQTGSTTIVEERVDSCIRLLQSKRITGVTSWNMTSGGGTLSSHTEYGYAGHLDDPDAPANDLNFGVPEELFFELASGALNVNQFNVYWSSYLAEITDKDSKIMSCTLHLYAKDIYRLDFSRLKNIDGNLYRINKITDFNATNEDTCEGEFLKVINRIY